MKVSDRIIRANIQLQRRCSFWAYLSLYLKFREVKKGEMLCDSMGVDEKGNVYYVKEFIDTLDDEELIGVIAHEINHLVFLSALRRGNRNHIGWNCSTDATINTLLKANNFKLPEGVIVADENDEINTGKNIIKNISKKNSEEIYDKLPEIEVKDSYYVVSGGKRGKKGKGFGKSLGKTLDEHIKGKDGKGGGLGKKEKEELEKFWGDRLAEAISLSRIKGDVPVGMERIINELHREKINWKALLSNYITNQIPYNSTWSSFHKKSVGCGFYLPNTLREEIDIVVGIDTSGSISEKDLKDFLSEIIGMARAYRERIKMTLIPCDCEIGKVYEIENGSIEKIKKDVKITGGGGTSFLPVINWVNENKRDTKLLLYLTDGYGDEVERQPFDILWVLSKGGSDELLKKSGRVIKLGD